jgi:hypothetical protein
MAATAGGIADERVFGGNDVFELEEAFEELEFRASERRHFRAVLRAAEHG